MGTIKFEHNDQAHQRQWSAAKLPSGAAPCYAIMVQFQVLKLVNQYQKLLCALGPK